MQNPEARRYRETFFFHPSMLAVTARLVPAGMSQKDYIVSPRTPKVFIGTIPSVTPFKAPSAEGDLGFCGRIDAEFDGDAGLLISG